MQTRKEKLAGAKMAKYQEDIEKCMYEERAFSYVSCKISYLPGDCTYEDFINALEKLLNRKIKHRKYEKIQYIDIVLDFFKYNTEHDELYGDEIFEIFQSRYEHYRDEINYLRMKQDVLILKNPNKPKWLK